MASLLDEASRNDSRTRATFIFYEFRSGKSIFSCYQDFCTRMGADYIDYQEFEFWFQRFSAGNFDLDYDRSKDPKYRNFTDLPVHVFEKVCENLGDNYQNEYRFTLRNVCKSFRTLVDAWIPDVKKISIDYSVYSPSLKIIILKCDNQKSQYKDENMALDDLTSILVHPKLKLETFNIRLNEEFVEKLVLKLEPLKTKIHVENISFNARFRNVDKPMLAFYQGETAEFEGPINTIWEFIDEISESDSKKRISKFRFPRILLTVKYRPLYMKDATKLVKDFLKCSNLKYCHMKADLRTTVQLKKNIERFGAKIQTDRPDTLHYSIPNSTDFFEIQIKNSGIRMERRS